MADKIGTLLTENNDILYPRTKASLIEDLGEFTSATWNLSLGASNRLLGMNSQGTGVEWIIPAAGTTVQNTIDDANVDQPVSGHAVFQALGGSPLVEVGALVVEPGLYSLDFRGARWPLNFSITKTQFLISAENAEAGGIISATSPLIYYKETDASHTYELFIYYVEEGSERQFYIVLQRDGVVVSYTGTFTTSIIVRRILQYI